MSRDRLVIWLMSYNWELSEYLASLGLHLIQPHYANRWFSTGPKETHDTEECLEAANEQDHSPLVKIPKPDGLAARSLNFVQWLAQKSHRGYGNASLMKQPPFSPMYSANLRVPRPFRLK